MGGSFEAIFSILILDLLLKIPLDGDIELDFTDLFLTALKLDFKCKFLNYFFTGVFCDIEFCFSKVSLALAVFIEYSSLDDHLEYDIVYFFFAKSLVICIVEESHGDSLNRFVLDNLTSFVDTGQVLQIVVPSSLYAS